MPFIFEHEPSKINLHKWTQHNPISKDTTMNSENIKNWRPPSLQEYALCHCFQWEQDWANAQIVLGHYWNSFGSQHCEVSRWQKILASPTLITTSLFLLCSLGSHGLIQSPSKSMKRIPLTSKGFFGSGFQWVSTTIHHPCLVIMQTVQLVCLDLNRFISFSTIFHKDR